MEGFQKKERALNRMHCHRNLKLPYFFATAPQTKCMRFLTIAKMPRHLESSFGGL